MKMRPSVNLTQTYYIMNKKHHHSRNILLPSIEGGVRRRVFFLLLFLLACTAWTGRAQGDASHPRPITLEEAILTARTQSVDAAVALNELKTAYWEYRTHRADLLPEMSLSASLPNYNKRYNSYQQEDGSYTFVRNNYLGMNGALAINQKIWPTGGTLSLQTSLDYMKQLTGDRTERYMSVPVALHTHCTAGLGQMTQLMAMMAGVDILDCAISAFSGLNIYFGSIYKHIFFSVFSI